jgi:hypothetical protein
MDPERSSIAYGTEGFAWMFSVSKRRRRSSNATVKKYDPPDTYTRT